MTDIVERLKKWERLEVSKPLPDAGYGEGNWSVRIAIDISDAIQEIEHLRSVARSVTWGAGDYRTIAKVARHDLCGNE